MFTTSAAKTTTPRKYFYILLVLQIVIAICMLISVGFHQIFMSLLRILLLVLSQYCKSKELAALYSIFCGIHALYAFDPVGLFITGHGDSRSLIENILAVLAFLLLIFAAYVGFLYKIALDYQAEAAPSSNNPFPSHDQAAPVPNNNYGASSGTQYQYNNPYQAEQRPQESQRNQFRAFQGKGYSLN